MRRLFFLAFAPGLFATNVFVGTDNLDNCLPFSCPLLTPGISEYQQVYAASQFPADFLISSIDFFEKAGEDHGVDTATFQISFSTTHVAVGNLSATLSDNVGPNSQPFATFSITAAPGATLHISGTPFLYDPSQWNLLMDVLITNASGPTTGLFFGMQFDQSGTFTSRAASGGFSLSGPGGGLVTEFEGVIAPEPATFALAGLALAFVAARRKS